MHASASASAGWPSSTSATAANQPMANEDGSLQVVFNGEIYNHAEIRAELEALGGHTWATDHSDTEVILHAFEEWGIDCLAPLPRHVRHRHLGRPRAGALADPRPHRHQAALLRRPRRTASRSPRRSRRCWPTRARRARWTRSRCSTTCRSSRRRRRGRSSRASASWPAARGCASAQDGTVARGALVGRLGPHRTRSSGSPRRRSPSGCSPSSATAVQLPQGQRCASRRLPLRRHRLEHERGALLRGRDAASAHVLDRIRGRLPELPERASLGPPHGRGGWRGPSRAAC